MLCSVGVCNCVLRRSWMILYPREGHQPQCNSVAHQIVLIVVAKWRKWTFWMMFPWDYLPSLPLIPRPGEGWWGVIALCVEEITRQFKETPFPCVATLTVCLCNKYVQNNYWVLKICCTVGGGIGLVGKVRKCCSVDNIYGEKVYLTFFVKKTPWCYSYWICNLSKWGCRVSYWFAWGGGVSKNLLHGWGSVRRAWGEPRDETGKYKYKDNEKDKYI